MWEVLSGIIGLIIGFFIASKIMHSDNDDAIRSLKSQKDADQDEYLKVLLRSLSHVMIVRDLDAYCRIKKRTFEKVKEFKKYSQDAKSQTLSLIAEEYPYINDFDKMNVKEFVLPLDSASLLSTEELGKVYEDIHIFLAQNNDPSVYPEEVLKKNEEFFEEYIQRLRDAVFKQNVLREINAYKNAEVASDKKNLNYNFRNIQILPLNHFAETRYGLHFKNTDEYAIYGIFYDDNSKAHETVYRSNKSYEAEESLDALVVDFVYEKQIVNAI